MNPARLLLQSACLSILFFQVKSLKEWVIMGGYTGIEGQGQAATSSVELLAFDDDASFTNPNAWCQRNMSVAPLPLDGATINIVDTFSYYKQIVQQQNTKFSGAHHSAQLNRVIVCGGADDKYVIQNMCRWWIPGTDTWLEGPKMLYPRYQATAIARPLSGQLWMMGGKDGSKILQENEVLQYPAIFEEAKKNFKLKRWEWANSKMKNSEVWETGVITSMKFLPIPLAGHCAVEVTVKEDVDGVEKNVNHIVLIGGGTTEIKEDGLTFVENSGPVPTDHVHVYTTSKNSWSSTFSSDLVTGKRVLKKSRIARMNHGCVSYTEGDKVKIMVAGGVSFTSAKQPIVLNQVEVLDFETGEWKLEANLPKQMTGSKLITVNNRPVVVGRYGNEVTNRMLMYSEGKTWEPLPANLLVGRSDFQLLADIPTMFIVNPKMNSKQTSMISGSGADRQWRNMFGEIKKGVKTIFKTNIAPKAWLQLDLGADMMVQQVYYESGLLGDDGVSVAEQLIEVRVGSDVVPPSEKDNIQVNEACALEINGLDAKRTNCKIFGRYVTLQLKNDALNQLHIQKIDISVESPKCAEPEAP